MTKGKFTFLLVSYCLVLIAWFLYSITQNDLNLTISSNNTLFTIQKFFQNIGYFQRPLSTVIFIGLLLLYFIFYLQLIILTVKKLISKKQIFILLLLTVVMLLLSYPAFSYDLFNYLFYGRIITHYGLSPYNFRALDFPADTWTRFMHWTHNTYPYGPIWLAITVPLSFLGQQKFIITLILYKLLMAGGFLFSGLFIYKIAKALKINNPLLILVLFSFNPLIIIESLISSHNDIVMIAFSLVGFYWLIKEKLFPSLLFILIASAVKLAVIPLFITWLIVVVFRVYKRSISLPKILLLTFSLMLLAFLYYLKDHSLQPWYFLWFFPFGLLLNSKYVHLSLIFLSLGFLGNYAPFLFFGNWDKPVPFLNTAVTLFCFLLGLIVSTIIYISRGSRQFI